jgi:hypothetical protein
MLKQTLLSASQPNLYHANYDIVFRLNITYQLRELHILLKKKSMFILVLCVEMLAYKTGDHLASLLGPEHKRAACCN